jgi:hypothetical protein
VFQPLDDAPAASRPALVWVHENVRGHLYEHYIPYVREATGRGFVVIAPEYRGSVGYGRPLYDAIDYGGAEVDDAVTAASVVAIRYPQVDASRRYRGVESRRNDRAPVRLPNPGASRSAVALMRSRTSSTGSRERATGRFGDRPAQPLRRPAVGRPDGIAIVHLSFTSASCGSRCSSTWRTTTTT